MIRTKSVYEILLLVCFAQAFSIKSVHSQANFPSKAVEIVVPSPAGSSTDLGARVFAEALQAHWSVPVNVINRQEGDIVPGTREVLHSAPDGHTVLMDGPGSSSMIERVVKNPPFDAMDRTFLALAAHTPLMFVVPRDSPWRTLKDAVGAAQADPAEFSWTSDAGPTDLAFRRLFQISGIDHTKTRPVQAKGGSEAINLTAGGHVKISVGFWGTLAPLVKAGRLRILAVAGPERFPATPDIRTTTEAGFPGLIILQWIGFSGPPGLSPAVVVEWQKAVREVSHELKVATSLERVGLVRFPANYTPMKDFVARETKVVQDLLGP